MATSTEQGGNAPETIHKPSDWAAKLVESSKIAPEEDEQSLAPQEEDAELEEEADAELEGDEPTSHEDQDEDEETELEADAEESEETEPSEDESTESSIVADGTYIVDGEEFDGQTLINGIAATKNFNVEKNRLRTEAREQLDAEMGELHAKRDEYAGGLNFMLGINQQAQQQYANVNWVQLQQESPAEYQKLKNDHGKLIQNQQQLQGQFDHFLTNVRSEQAESSRRGAESSMNILRDEFGGEEGWAKRYPELRKVANDYGYKADEFNTLTDHRFMSVLSELDKAKSQINEMKSVATKKAAKPVKENRKRNSQRVNTSQNRQLGDAHKKFLKSHSPKDAAALIMQSQKKRG